MCFGNRRLLATNNIELSPRIEKDLIELEFQGKTVLILTIDGQLALTVTL